MPEQKRIPAAFFMAGYCGWLVHKSPQLNVTLMNEIKGKAFPVGRPETSQFNKLKFRLRMGRIRLA